MNSEEPFEVRHFLSKTLHLFTKSTGSASEWFLSTIYLSLVGLFPTVGHTKTAVIPTPRLFIERKYAVSFNNLCRKYREPDLHCINKKCGITTLFRKKKKKQPAILFRAARNTSQTLAHTHTKENNEKLVLICPPLLYPQPSGPKLWTFPAGCLGHGWYQIKNNKVFRVLVIWVNHLIANCVCGTIIL